MAEFNLPDKHFFRTDEVAKILNVSRSTIYRWISEGTLEAVRIKGYTIRIQKNSLQNILKGEGS